MMRERKKIRDITKSNSNDNIGSRCWKCEGTRGRKREQKGNQKDPKGTNGNQMEPKGTKQ